LKSLLQLHDARWSWLISTGSLTLTGLTRFEMKAQTWQLNDACVKKLGAAKVDPWH